MIPPLHQPWDRGKDDARLIELRPHMKNQQIGRLMQRTPKQVYTASARLGIAFVSHEPRLSPEQAHRLWQDEDRQTKGDPATRVGWTLGHQFAAVPHNEG